MKTKPHTTALHVCYELLAIVDRAKSGGTLDWARLEKATELARVAVADYATVKAAGACPPGWTADDWAAWLADVGQDDPSDYTPPFDCIDETCHVCGEPVPADRRNCMACLASTI